MCRTSKIHAGPVDPQLLVLKGQYHFELALRPGPVKKLRESSKKYVGKPKRKDLHVNFYLHSYLKSVFFLYIPYTFYLHSAVLLLILFIIVCINNERPD